MKSQIALDFIRNKLVEELNLIPLDVPTRTKAQYFRTSGGKVFGLLLGDLESGRFAYKTSDLLLEPCDLPVGLLGIAENIAQPYRGSSTHAPSKGVFLKDAQTRVRVDSEVNLRIVLAWYSSGQFAASTLSDAKSKCPPHPPAPVMVREAVLPSTRPVITKPISGKLPIVPEKGLLIRDPWIEKILRGEKVWEMRSRSTHERGWVALIKAGTGMVYGLARIVDSLGELTEVQMLAKQDKHGISAQRLPEVPNYRYAWVLEDVQRLSKPVPYRHQSGAVIFARLDQDAKTAIAAQLAA